MVKEGVLHNGEQITHVGLTYVDLTYVGLTYVGLTYILLDCVFFVEF